MIRQSMKAGGYTWEKVNFITKTDKRGGFDHFKCPCGVEGKSYAIGEIEIKEKFKSKAKACPNFIKPKKIKIIEMTAVGAQFENLTPDSIHEVIESPPTRPAGEVWVNGIDEPVRLLEGEYIEHIEEGDGVEEAEEIKAEVMTADDEETRFVMIDFELTDTELVERGRSLARAYTRKIKIKQELDKIKAEFKRKIASTDYEIDYLSKAIDEGKEQRETEVVYSYHEPAFSMQSIFNAKTGELIKVEEMADNTDELTNSEVIAEKTDDKTEGADNE